MSEAVQSALTCPSCKGPCTETLQESELFYGADEGVPLRVNHIVITCDDLKCRESFCDYRAEEAREATTQAYRRAFAGPFVDLLGRYLPMAKLRLLELTRSQDVTQRDEAKAHLADLKTVDAALAAIFVYEPPPQSYVVKDWVYAFVMARIDELIFSDPAKDSPHGVELASLVSLAECYESELFPSMTSEPQA